MNFETQVISTIREYNMIPPGAHILVGISGGADSVCLLALLEHLRRENLLNVELRAVHVHHGLRASAEEDVLFVRGLCGELGIPAAVYRVDAAAEAKRRRMSTEEAGRMLRREIYRRECARWMAQEDSHGVFRVALAHHLEDSAETLLFHLCRGSSTAGLTGIRPVSALDMAQNGMPVDVIRPLIRTSRMQIEEWLEKNGYTWRLDETNTDTRYTRNYLRNEILPALEANVNAGCAEHMARAALDLAEAEEYLKDETNRRLADCRIEREPGSIACSVERLKEQVPFWRRRILHEAMVQAISAGGAGNPSKDIASSHVDALLRLLDAEGSARIYLPRGLTARKEYDTLTFVSGTDPAAYPARQGHYLTRVFPYREGMEIPSGPYTKWVDYDTITQSLSFRARRDGDVITLEQDGCGGYHCKKLARVMIDRKIPARLRDQMVLPMDGSHVVWFPGYRIGAEYRITGKTRTVLEICWEVESNGRGVGPDSARTGGEENS